MKQFNAMKVSRHLMTHSLEFDRGARSEIRTILTRLRKELKQVAHLCRPFEIEVLRDLEQWLVERRKRYKT